jgi:tetratricopeptide (TPR) repeat protein
MGTEDRDWRHPGAPGADVDARRTTLEDYVPAVDQRARLLIARIQRDHADVEAIKALAEHYETHGDLPSLANLMEGWASTLRDDRRAAEAHLRAARAVLEGLLDRPRAEQNYMRALERAPELESAMLELEAMLRTRGDDTELERCLSRSADALRHRNADPRMRARVHERLGELYERMRLPSRAIAQYRAALELDSNATDAIAAAREIYLGTGRPDAAADMYELEIAASDLDERKVVLLRALADHRQELQSDFDGAVLTLRRLLKLAPDDVGALERLAEMLCVRSEGFVGDGAQADRTRAAELYFQVARYQPRAHAAAALQRCLKLQPDHARALSLRAELEAYGAGNAGELVDGDVSQAELEQRATARYTPATARRIGGSGTRTVQPAAGPTHPTDAQADDLDAWLNDDEVELIEEEVGPQNMVSLSERPPPS